MKKRSASDSDIAKGAIEQEDPRLETPTTLSGQLPHRTSDSMLKDNDSDFPEPGSNPEHSGQHSDMDNPEGSMQDQDPGHRQKENQNKSKDDPLAA